MIRKEGWLMKRSGFLFKTWEQRWFVLNDLDLSYYRMRSDNEPRLTIHIPSATVLQAAEGRIGAPTASCFEVIVDQHEEGDKSYYMCTETEGEMIDWMRVLKEAGAVTSIPESHKSESGALTAVTAATSADPPICVPTSMDDNAKVVLSRVWPCPADLLRTPRTLVKSGELMEFDPARGERQKTQLLLFNDVLLFTWKDHDGYYNLQVHVSLVNNPSIFSSESSPLEFQIHTHTQRTFILYARTQEERNAWVSAVSRAIACTASQSSPSVRGSDSERADSGLSPIHEDANEGL